MAHPKYEGQVVVPTGGYSLTLTLSGLPVVCTLAAGTYYLGTLLTALAAAISTATAATWTVVCDDDANASTGRITISTAGSPGLTLVTWTSTALRDLLGYTGSETITGGNSVQGAGHSRYLWLPDVGRGPALAPDGTAGILESDGVMSLAPSGNIKVLAYNIRRRDVITHEYLSGRKVWSTYVTYANEALERFYTDVIGLGVPFRYFPARETDATYVGYVPDAEAIASMGVAAMDPAWTSSAYAQWGWRCPVREKVA